MRKITVITVTYNDLDALSKTFLNLRSFKKQFYEYIVIDGGSTDGTLEYLKSNIDIVDKWVSEKDSGIYDAMNKGWSLANIDSHIIYLGAGDQLISLPSIKDGDSRNVIFGHVVRESIGVFKSKVDFRLILVNTIHHQALLIPKSINPQPPFDTRYKIYADFDFNQRLYKRNITFIYSEATKGFATFGGVSQMLNIEEMASVSLKNFGFLAMVASYLFLYYQKSKHNFKLRMKVIVLFFLKN